MVKRPGHVVRQEVTERLRTACSLNLAVSFWNFPFNIFEPWLTAGN